MGKVDSYGNCFRLDLSGKNDDETGNCVVNDTCGGWGHRVAHRQAFLPRDAQKPR